MRTETTSTGKLTFLEAADILKYFLEKDDAIDTLIKCRKAGERITTTDRELYEALGSLKSYDEFSLPKLVKFFETVVIDHDDHKIILTHQKVEELRKLALREVKNG